MIIVKRRLLLLRQREKGFTLIEVLITIAMVGFALIVMMEMFSVAGRGGESVENLSIATNLAQQRIEEIKHLVQSGLIINVGTGISSGDFLPFLSSVNTESYLNGSLYLTESDDCVGAAPSLFKMTPPLRVDRITQVEWAGGVGTYKKVQVTVFWQEKGEAISCGLVTLIRE